jgi:hypothetical protein
LELRGNCESRPYSLEAESFAPKVAKYTIRSANGAEYESQGQVRSEAEHVAPGKNNQKFPALKGRNLPGYFGPSGLGNVCSS